METLFSAVRALHNSSLVVACSDARDPKRSYAARTAGLIVGSAPTQHSTALQRDTKDIVFHIGLLFVWDKLGFDVILVCILMHVALFDVIEIVKSHSNGNLMF